MRSHVSTEMSHSSSQTFHSFRSNASEKRNGSRSPGRDPSSQNFHCIPPKPSTKTDTCWLPGRAQRFEKNALPVTIGSYTVDKLLAKGFEGEVYQGTDANGVKVAMKLMDFRMGNNEANVMSCLQQHRAGGHPNILYLRDLTEFEQKAFVVTEYASGGDLWSIISKNGIFDERKLFLDLIEGLDHCHEHGVFHGDIKPQNLLVVGKVLKIGDFGMSQILDKKKYFEFEGCGTAPYLAPELLKGEEHHRFEPDVWAAGITLLAMFGYDYPFKIDKKTGEPKITPVSEAIGWNRIEDDALKGCCRECSS
eukprot:TRINITY_DN13587_c0_g2_i2.p1 TRINITY_DN13587_c0_g2~~TRINITY_DN13587_c0_g2_i2.p1  ORF type:complete len:345 (+),score=14.95 TRINITY_DN13587_c0_g2_i2:116-1036(+)